jgi:DHA1 family tetracycline resistance protein-like MFS transporter
VSHSPGLPLRFSRPSALLSALLTLLNDRLSESLFFPLLPFLLAPYSSDGRVLGLLIASYSVAQFAATPLIGALSDRFGRKPVMTICVAGSVLGLGLFTLTFILPWARFWPWGAAAGVPLALLFTARLLDGVSGGTAATAGAVLADVTPPEGRAKAFGLFGVSFGLAFILGPGLGGAMAQVSLTLPLLAALAFALLNLVVVITLLPETHPLSARLPMPRRSDLQPFSPVVQVFSDPRVRRLGLAFFSFFLAFNGCTALLVLYFKQAFAWGPTSSAMAFLVVGVVAMLVQGVLIGPLVGRWGESRLILVGLAAVISGCLMLCLATAATANPLAYVAVAALALGTGLVTPCLRGLVSRRLEGGGQGAALGSLQALQSLGSFIGPALGGLAFEGLGARSPFVLAILLLAATGLMLLEGGTRQAGWIPDSRP